MNRRRKRIALLLLLLLLLLLWLCWNRRRTGFWFGRAAAGWFERFGAPARAPAAPTISLPPPAAPVIPAAPRRHEHPAPLAPRSPLTVAVSTPAAKPPTPLVPTPLAPPVIPPGQEGMHRELIPKTITIVRCYYDRDVVAPDTTFDFDINGSGFTEEFHQMITLDADALDVSVKNLRLVTANQIHGQILVGPEATTQYIYPKILIRGLPVFKAPEPFGVCRRGEVLDIELVNIDETGQAGQFRVITNLDEALYKKFRVDPTTPRLEIEGLAPKLPFYIDGVLRISPGLTNGQYGLRASLGSHELFRKDPLVDVVRPNVGRTGSVDGLKATEPAHRPGDRVEFTLHGSGFIPSDCRDLSLKVNEFDMGPASFTYVSAGRLNAAIQVPMNAGVGIYGVTVYSRGKNVFDKKAVFGIVPANWLSTVKLEGPLQPGQTGTLLITGRDMAWDFVQGLELSADDPGLRFSKPLLRDPAAVTSQITVSTSVAAGDYLVHVNAHGQAQRLPGGAIIRIGS